MVFLLIFRTLLTVVSLKVIFSSLVENNFGGLLNIFFYGYAEATA